MNIKSSPITSFISELRRRVVTAIKLCGFSKSNGGLKVVSLSDSRQIHLHWTGLEYIISKTLFARLISMYL